MPAVVTAPAGDEADAETPMGAADCLTDDDLRAFLLGEMPERLAQTASDHLERCPDCEAAAQRLDGLADPLVRSLRRALNDASCAGTVAWTRAPAAEAAAPPPPSADPPRVAGYTILGELGRGGMSVVYQARQDRPARLVALKMILAGPYARAERRARFLFEAEAIGRLQHPNIVQIYEVGRHDGVPFLALEFVDGASLDRRLNGAPMPPRAAAALVETLARAVHHAHEKGVVHRDLKPANVLIAADGTPKVTDFGLAKQERPELTATGDLLGTPSYMAPEQAAGANGAVGPACDVYALGVILYECLTGRPPFKAATALETLELVRTQEPVAPSGLQPRTPRDLETICLKCLEKQPDRRYATAAALAEDLRRYQSGEAILARPPGPAGRLWRWVQRKPGWAAALLLLACVAAGASAAAVLLARAYGESEAARGREADARRDAERKRWRSLVNEARATRLSRRPGQRLDALARIAEAKQLADELKLGPNEYAAMRNEAIAAMALPDLQITKEWPGYPPGTASVALSDDFEVYARTTDRGGCTIRRVADDTEVTEPLPELGEPAIAGFGPGRLLALRGESGRFQLWDVSGARPALRFEERDIGGVGGVGHQAWGFQSDGRLVAIAHQNGDIGIHDTATGNLLHRWPSGGDGRFHSPAFHPTEPLLALSSYFSRVVSVRDFRTGAVVAEATSPWSDGNGGCAWGRDGRTLLVANGEWSGQIQEYAFDPAATPPLQPTRTLDGPGQGDPVLTVNPAGDRFVTRGWSGTVNLFDTVSGQLLFATPWLRYAGGYDLHFDCTGSRLAAARVGERNERVGLWSVADGREYRSLVPEAPKARAYQGPAIHCGGRLAAVGLTDGLALFDLESGRELAHLAIPGGECSVAFDGEGNLLSNSFGGFFRWPVRSDPAEPGRVTVGPPERLPFPPGRCPIAASRNGRVIAQGMFSGYRMQPYAGGWILRPNSPKPLQVDAKVGMGYCSVSPDGCWVAFMEGAGRLFVHDAATGDCVWQFPGDPPTGSHSFFSRPDGRWLMTDVDGGRLYATGSWKPGPQLGPGIPWDATSDLAVLGLPNGIYRLVELTTGREVVRLEGAEPTPGDCQAAFTPDGAKLVIRADNGLRVWDLRLIRRQLAEMGLDWEAPPYPSRAPDAGPERLEVVVAP